MMRSEILQRKNSKIKPTRPHCAWVIGWRGRGGGGDGGRGSQLAGSWLFGGRLMDFSSEDGVERVGNSTEGLGETWETDGQGQIVQRGFEQSENAARGTACGAAIVGAEEEETEMRRI